MAVSLEVKSPFLDQQVIELAWNLPDSAKLNFGRRKWLLQRIAASCVPAYEVYRPKKGFSMPLPEWFRGKLGIVLEHLLENSVAAEENWIRLQPIHNSLDSLESHRNGKNHATRLWLILWLELWFRLVVRGEARESLGLE